MKNPYKNENGSALIVTMILSSIISVIVVTMLELTHLEYRLDADFISHEKALISADAGFDLAKKELLVLDHFPFKSTMNGNYYVITMDKKQVNKIEYKIISHGEYRAVEINVTALIICDSKALSQRCFNPKLLYFRYD